MRDSPTSELAVFRIAFSIEADELREEYLQQVCGSDQRLYNRVAELLQASEESSGFLESPPTGVGHTLDLSPISEKPGTQIGPYKLREQIGEGGFGVVYVAEQQEPVARKVALKIIKPGMDTKDVIARFEAERQALALMDHPNVAKVLDAGATASGRPYFAMELVPGMPITEFCDEQRFSNRERLLLFIDVCRAVQHAHQKGIIHRDLKPSNILVTLDDGRPLPKVIDFGVSKALSRKLTDKSIYTAYGQMVGTPLYMAPEQAALSLHDVDTRSDVYSLGVLLYELLTGTTPFDKDTLKEAGFDELRRIIREDEPPRPSDRVSTLNAELLSTACDHRKVDRRSLGNSLRGEIDWIVMKALEKDRGRRYESASAFAADVKRYLNHEAVEACPPSFAYRLKKFTRRNKAAIVPGCLVATALIVGSGIATWQAIRARAAERAAVIEQQCAESERNLANQEKNRADIAAARAQQAARRAAEEAEKARNEAAIATAMSDFLQQDLLGMAAPERQFQAEFEPDPDIKLQTLLDRALDKVEQRFADQPGVRASVQYTLGRSFLAVGRYSDAIELLRQVQSYLEQTVGMEDPHALKLANELAIAYGAAGHYDKAVSLHERVLELRREILGPEQPATLTSMHNLAVAYQKAGQYDQSVALHEETLELCRKVFGPQHPHTLHSLNGLANAYENAGDYDRAMALYNRVLETRGEILGPEHPATLISRANLANAYRAAGDYDKAVRLLDEALELCRKTFGPQHPNTLSSMSNLAEAYRAAGDYDQAIAIHERVLELRREDSGPEHPATIASMNNLAVACRAAGQLQRALSLFEQALELSRKKLGPQHPNTLSSMSNLGDAYSAAGEHDKAIALHEQALNLKREKLGPEHPATIASMNNLAEAFQRAGEHDKAVELHEQALETYRERLGPEHPDTLRSMSNLAITYQSVGRLVEALPLFEQSLELRRKILGAEHPDTLKSMKRLASAYRAAGQHDKAVAVYEQMLEVRLAISGPEHAATLDSMNKLGAAYYSAGRFDKSVNLLEQTLALRRKHLGPEHAETLQSMNNLAVACVAVGQYEKARLLLENALDLQRKVLGTEHRATLTSMHNLACAYRNASELDKAHMLAQQTLEIWQSKTPANPKQLAGAQAILAACLLAEEKWTAAEPLLRECLKLRQQELPDRWVTYDAMRLLGSSLLGQGKYEEAERFLVQGYEGLNRQASTIPAYEKHRIRDAAEQLARLYEEWNRPEAAAKWREKARRKTAQE